MTPTPHSARERAWMRRISLAVVVFAVVAFTASVVNITLGRDDVFTWIIAVIAPFTAVRNWMAYRGLRG